MQTVKQQAFQRRYNPSGLSSHYILISFSRNTQSSTLILQIGLKVKAKFWGTKKKSASLKEVCFIYRNITSLHFIVWRYWTRAPNCVPYSKSDILLDWQINKKPKEIHQNLPLALVQRLDLELRNSFQQCRDAETWWTVCYVAYLLD